MPSELASNMRLLLTMWGRYQGKKEDTEDMEDGEEFDFEGDDDDVADDVSVEDIVM